jgi:hypothetical protein
VGGAAPGRAHPSAQLQAYVLVPVSMHAPLSPHGASAQSSTSMQVVPSPL